MDSQILARLLMLSFEGSSVPSNVRTTLGSEDVSGVTLFRPNNYVDPDQLLNLTRTLQDSRYGETPLLIAIDQEGGQLHAFGAPATMWPGNMALGAADDTDLTLRVGAAIGRELRAAGINVDYAPVADLATNPDNPATGVRAFGDEPRHVARHVAAIIEGIQSQGVAATMKHFPGKGSSEVDSHLAMPVITHDRDRLDDAEFVPFIAAISAGVKVTMTGHFALPAVTGSRDLPCTLSHAVNTGLLRDQFGFTGPLITDALDMKALSQGAAQVVDVIAAVRSGVDLLLMTADAQQEERVITGLSLALSRQLISPDRLAEANRRVIDLREWTKSFEAPSLSVVGSTEHQDLALELARRSITLLKNDRQLVPLNLGTQQRILVIEAPPRLLTPADTSDLETPSVAVALGDCTDASVDAMVMPLDGSIPFGIDAYDVVVVVTDAANLDQAQAAFARTIIASHNKVIAIARRTPYDINEFPAVDTFLCCWSINRSSATAVAEAITGRSPITGHLPVSFEGYPLGSGINIP
jgi:beta-N-acetylhexosaminidase